MVRFCFIHLVFVAPILAQESPEPPLPAAVQEKLREWVRVQELTIEEEANWKEEQLRLADLNQLRQQEIAGLDETISASSKRITFYDEKLGALESEGTELKEGRQQLQARIEALETRALTLMKSLPTPVLDKLGETAPRLENPEPDLPLQNRYRDVLAVLIEAGNFDRKLSVQIEVREIDGSEAELEVLYLGLSRAYYVDRTGKRAGVGVPGADGWTWTSEPKLAGEIRQAIQTHQQKAPPTLTRLPVQVED
ncbi:MAG: DUF3450 family protein [Verrucomicrobiota bacterium]